MLKIILLASVVIIAGFLVTIALQSPEMFISRELLIRASPEVLFPYINNSKKTNEWMPWSESDPQAKMIYSGPDEGLGSISNWDSTGKMGTGRAEVVASEPNRSVQTQLTYTKPMEMSQLAEVSLTPAEQGTLVRWSVSGKNTFMGRLFCVFVNMDKMVGAEFEKGLKNLKTLAEKGPQGL